MGVHQWFSYNKEKNGISLRNAKFISVIPYLRGRDFSIQLLSTFKDEKEISLLRLSEPTFWTRKDHYIEIAGLIEEDNDNPIYFVQIELDHGGIIRYDSEILIVMFPENESLKEITIEMLKSNGYFAAELLWEFCEKRPEEFSLDYILALEEKDITDEFERMLLFNEELKKGPF
jgi:hypothetical protein